MILEFLINGLALIVTLGILVTIHEFGHFWVARRCGVKVLRFSIGFGKAAKTWIGKDGVEYVLAPIPLGGYVKMLGQEDTTVTTASEVPASQQHLSFASKSLWQRMAIVAAGPVANFILAIFIFWLINIAYGVTGVAPVISNIIEDSIAEDAGLRLGDEIIAVDGEPTMIWQQVTIQMLSRMGESGELSLTIDPTDSSTNRELRLPISAWMGDEVEPDPLRNLGIVRFELPAAIASVIAGGAAERGGLQADDEIVSVNGEAITSWDHWVDVIRANPELALDVVVERSDGNTGLVLIPERTAAENGQDIGTIGAYVKQSTLREILPADRWRSLEYNVFTAVQPAMKETWDMSVFVLASVKKMVVGLISVKNINGPITIAQVAGETATYGLEVYLGVLALLSISLGVLNLMPIPVLDGGHLLYYAIEAVIRRPVPERVQAWGLQLGLLMISGIMMLAIYNDVNRFL